MKKEYKELFDNIKPDSELMYDTFNKADEKKKSPAFMPRRIVAAALAIAVLVVGGGFGINQLKAPDFISENDTTITGGDTLSAPLFTITAYAGDNENAEIKTLSEDEITLMDYKIQLKKDSDGYYIKGHSEGMGFQINADDIKQVTFSSENGKFDYLDTPFIEYKESIGEYYDVRLPITKEEAKEYNDTIESGKAYPGYKHDFVSNIMKSRDCSEYFGDKSTDLELYSFDYSDMYGADEFVFRNREKSQKLYMQFNKKEIIAKTYPNIEGIGEISYNPDGATDYLINHPETSFDKLPTDKITIKVEFNSGQTVTKKLLSSFTDDGTLMFSYID